MSAIPGFFTAAEAAAHIGVSQAQITRYIQAHLLGCRRVGRELLLDEKEVRRFQRPPRGNPNFRKNSRRRKGRKKS